MSATVDGQHSVEIHHAHREVNGGWLRPTVFGMMDGLCSNFALIAGVAGAHTSAKAVVLAGFAGLAGGAFSMATGEYTSVRSQNESVAAEVDKERLELQENPGGEGLELERMYVRRGLDAELAHMVVSQLSMDPERALDIHVYEELGVDRNDLPSPWVAAVSSFLSFTAGAAVPLIPYILGFSALAISAILALVSLFLAGAAVSSLTSRAWWYSGSRQLIFGLAAAAVTYSIGYLVGATVGLG